MFSTCYLKNQDPQEALNVRTFIQEVEQNFRENYIIAGNMDTSVNKPITGSHYFSFRNERALVHKMDSEELLDHNNPPVQGNAIVIKDNYAYFVKDRKWVKERDLIGVKLKRIDITKNRDYQLRDGNYFPADLAQEIELGSAYNPFNYQDNVFQLKHLMFIQKGGNVLLINEKEEINKSLLREDFVRKLENGTLSFLFVQYQKALAGGYPTEAIQKQLGDFATKLEVIILYRRQLVEGGWQLPSEAVRGIKRVITSQKREEREAKRKKQEVLALSSTRGATSRQESVSVESQAVPSLPKHIGKRKRRS